jgi:hypothetical protein
MSPPAQSGFALESQAIPHAPPSTSSAGRSDLATPAPDFGALLGTLAALSAEQRQALAVLLAAPPSPSRPAAVPDDSLPWEKSKPKGESDAG